MHLFKTFDLIIILRLDDTVYKPCTFSLLKWLDNSMRHFSW
jgi:hypothetical protein